MGNVVEEGMAGAQCVHGRRADGRERIAFNHVVVFRVGHAIPTHTHDDLGVAIEARNELAVGVGAQQRHVEHIEIVERDAQERDGLCLDFSPVGNAPVGAVQQVPGGDRRTRHRVCRVFAQEHLVRGVRGVGLVLVDERGRGVDGFVGLVVRRSHDAVRARRGHGGCAGQRHEVGSAGDIERIVRLQGDVDRAVARLGNQVQPVVEELAEQGHPAVERWRKPDVGRQVLDRDAAVGRDVKTQTHGQRETIFRGGPGQDGCRVGHRVGRAGQLQGLEDGGKVAQRLVRDQVADDARVGIGNADVGVVVGVGDDRRARAFGAQGHHVPVKVVQELGLQQAGHDLVGRAQQLLAGEETVVAAIHGAQARWQQGADGCAIRVLQHTGVSVVFGDEDLFENFLEVAEGDSEVGGFGGHDVSPEFRWAWGLRKSPSDGDRGRWPLKMNANEVTECVGGSHVIPLVALAHPPGGSRYSHMFQDVPRWESVS